MPRSRKRPNHLAVLALLAMIILLGWVCVMCIADATRQLRDLAKISGPLQSAEVVRRLDKGYRYHVEFGVGGDSIRPALKMPGLLEAQQLQARCVVGEVLVVYYEPNAAAGRTEPNFHVYQIQAGNTIIYSLAEGHRKARKDAWYMGVITVLFASMLIGKYLEEYKGR